MNCFGKTFGRIVATGAFLIAGVLLVNNMTESLRSIWESENRKGAKQDE